MKKQLDYNNRMKKRERFLDKYLGRAWIFWVPAGIIVAIIICLIAKQIPLSEQQKAKLYAKEQIITEDFSKLPLVEDTMVEVEDSNLIVTFEEKDCKIVAMYDKNYNLISKMLIDTRISSGRVAWIIFTFWGLFWGAVMYVVSSIALGTSFAITSVILRRKEKRRT